MTGVQTCALPILSVLGVELTADTLSLEAQWGAERTVSITATGVTISLGDGGSSPLVTVEVASAGLTVSSTGIVAVVTGATLTSAIAGISLAGGAGLHLDTTDPSNQFVRVTLGDESSPATLTVADDGLWTRWNPATGRALATFAVGEGTPLALAALGDDEFLAAFPEGVRRVRTARPWFLRQKLAGAPGAPAFVDRVNAQIGRAHV